MYQTNRTILFQKINMNKVSLIQLIPSEEEKLSISDEVLQVIKQELVVSSYEEVIDKFDPCIYVKMDFEIKEVYFSYYECPEFQKLQLCRNETLFDAMLRQMNMMRDKTDTYVEYENEHLLYCSPVKYHCFLQQLQRLKKAIRSDNSNEWMKLLDRIRKDYNDGIFLLTFYTWELGRMLERTSKKNRFTYLWNNENPYLKRLGNRILQEKYLCEEDGRFDLKMDNQADIISEYFKKHPWCYSDIFQKILLCHDTYKEEKNKECYLEYQEQIAYQKKVLELFYEKVSPLMKVLMGIHEFFYQYGDTEAVMHPTMLIANCDLEIMEETESSLKLELYLETVNTKNYDNDTIWYAILPGLRVQHNIKEFTRKRFQGRDLQPYTKNLNHLSLLLINLLGKYRIQTFVSLEAHIDTTLNFMDQSFIEEIVRPFSIYETAIYKEFIYPCYPNMLIYSSNNRKKNMGKQVAYDTILNQYQLTEEIYIYLEEWAVEASYIAAGICAAYQCPAYLKRFYKGRTNETYTGTAFQICNPQNLRSIPVMMRAAGAKLTKECIEYLVKNSKGILFLPEHDKIVLMTDHAFSYHQRQKDTISTVQTTSYIERIIRKETFDYSETMLKELIHMKTNSAIYAWANNRNGVNAILKPGESIQVVVKENGKALDIIICFQEVEYVIEVHYE